MEMHYCWRCKATLPFLDEVEFGILESLLGIPAMTDRQSREWRQLDQIPLDIFESITGYRLRERAAIRHHRLSTMGPICADCGHLLRSPAAKFCANCWQKVAAANAE